MGSSESTVTRLDKLSAAAGKFNVMIGTSIKRSLANATAGTTVSTSNSLKDTSRNTRVIKRVIADCTAEDATLYAKKLFDIIAAKGNSEEYTNSKSNFDTLKSRTLSELGVDKYDKLTPEQRKVYAKKMIEARAPFKYTSQSIHIKYGDFQTIYSITRRVLGTAHWADSTVNNLMDITDERKKYRVTMRNASPESKSVQNPTS